MAPVKVPVLHLDPRDDGRALTAALGLANGNLKCSRAFYERVRERYQHKSK